MPTITSNITRVSKAILTNIFAGLAPKAYMRYTHETGRGLQEEGSGDITTYFFQCYEDYLRYLDLTDDSIKDYLNNKVLLEYGPGDLPGMALIFYAKGANKVYCVDRFPLLSFSAFNSEALQTIIDKLSPDEQQRAKNCFKEFGNPGSGLKPECIEYITHKKGLSQLDQAIDLIYSRAVLEHVNSLPETFQDMYRALKPSGIALHKVDLKSHGLHQENPLDFLTWPDYLWNIMYCNKGVPNRYRIDKYRKVIGQTAFKIELLEAVEECDEETAQKIKPKLAKKFSDISIVDLKWLSFWMRVKKR
ncbi:methyltransferase domain-containing protein [Methylotuvimicrobium alcaliphilum]|uniref:Methyltransferase type 12 n=1 Tax=Methylotuvimicrobium alcaliphilum (strain DSM 19304 / NCIMB 14124 / VKM B-2133 / 20Z) TaxID=1091494 RepID=G4SYS7_META2|nr:methyltransferase domain-containing protein [Methylotuvimicrobium alcaliphilum]CCE24374.1 Methyltransferase type 12 [Methylotuvimicrobium alcaliphilum 20Z]